jgi:DNA (cytosine-5)-methyltransferase 1
VKGLIQGKAIGYALEIENKFKKIGYNLQIFLLNAATMGVPQKRERVFFIAHRNDLKFKPLKLLFNQKLITFGDVQGKNIMIGKDAYPTSQRLWGKCKRGDKLSTVHPTGNFFSSRKLSNDMVVNTITASDGSSYLHPDYPKRISDEALGLIQSFPKDYDYNDLLVQYVCGMSVPPVMMAQIAQQIKLQWFDNE